jgi:hypothetical protein
MISQRRAAQLGLLATGVVLISSFGILVGQGDETQSKPAQGASTPSAPIATPPQSVESSAPVTVSLSAPIQPAQTGSVR